MIYLGAELGADLPIIAQLFAVIVASVYLMSTCVKGRLDFISSDVKISLTHLLCYNQKSEQNSADPFRLASLLQMIGNDECFFNILFADLSGGLISLPLL